ncbi:MAG: NYN domain-containing protein [Thermoanaerobaculales bacterium]|jgi:predicted RNA-binding protein with PIN domain|nr:NYN domain-containing protein [Thermoanaerobaculales bacterium]
MPLLIDGNNLLHRLPQGDRSRTGVRRQVLEATRHETISVTVVFDGPPPEGMSARESLGNVTIAYSGVKSADDVIVASLPPGKAASQFSVVTDDRELAARVRDRGARVRTLAQWRGRRRRPSPTRPRVESKLSSNEVAEWESFFAGEASGDAE